MYKINEDILMFAISEYLKEKDLAPYDAMLENSLLGSIAKLELFFANDKFGS